MSGYSSIATQCSIQRSIRRYNSESSGSWAIDSDLALVVDDCKATGSYVLDAALDVDIAWELAGTALAAATSVVVHAAAMATIIVPIPYVMKSK